MKGIVDFIDKKSGYFIIRDNVGEFTLALVMGKFDISVGTTLSGSVQKLGCSKLANTSTKQIMPILIIDSHCSEKDVMRKLRRAKRNLTV